VDDPRRRALQKAIDATLPKTVKRHQLRRENEKRVLIRSVFGRRPGTYYLYDSEKKKLEHDRQAARWIDPNLMAERKFITYKARDGMEIPAYVTIPKGGGKNLPLV
jgi:dipeptidyl aminopeptidase/acylaminoacyl peptidase